MLRSRVFAVILILLGGVAVAAAKDFALISNKSNHVEAVTLAELVKICKGQMEHWPDGKAVSLVTRDPASPEMRIVLEKIYGIPKEEVLGLITLGQSRAGKPSGHCGGGFRRCGGEKSGIESGRGGPGGCVRHHRRRGRDTRRR